MSRTAAVQMPALNAPVHRPESTPIAPTSRMTTSEPDRRFCAYWRSNSVSNAGRVPDVEVSLSRASRTLCEAARRRVTVDFSVDASLGGYVMETLYSPTAAPKWRAYLKNRLRLKD